MLIPPVLLLNLFVVVVMFSIGLRVSGGELLDILRKRALFVRTLLANCVLIPAIGFLLVRVFPLTPDASVGILLLGARERPSPCSSRAKRRRACLSLPP
jgi:predicted Na+-dependent transporter